MRRSVIFVVVACLVLIVGGTVLFVWPSVAPVIAHHQHGYTNAILTQLLTPPPQGPFQQYWPYILLGIAVVMYGTMSYHLKHRKSTTHGSARYARKKETKPYALPRENPLKNMFRWPTQGMQPFMAKTPGFRLLLGRYAGREIALSEQQQYEHVLLTAPTGAGKSTRFFLPNLLRETGVRSLFIADLKNELYQITAGWLSQSMQIWLFAPAEPSISAGYNPLAHIHSVEDAQDFAEAWVLNTGTSSKESFWDTNSKLLIAAMTLHLVATEQAPAFSRLADLLTTRPFEEIRDTLRTSRSREARYMAAQFLESMERNERLVGSQMADVGNRFQLLASQDARSITATDDINFQEMMQTPTAFFLSIPRASTRRYRPLLAVLVQQMFAAWERRGTRGIGCYLDEFTNLGYLPGYAEFISTARALKVSLLMAIQNFAQLDERYGRQNADTIKANAVTHLLLPGAGQEETEYYSKRIGDTTIRTETINRRGYGVNQEISSTEGETRRRLMMPEELRTMAPGKMLMLEAKSPPLLLTTKQYFQDKVLAGRANLPYHVTRVRQEPAAPRPAPSAPQGLPPGQPQKPPIVVDADLEDDDAFLAPE